MKKSKSNKTTAKKRYNDKAENTLEYYGILMKNGRARIDTKRFSKFFTIPDKKIEQRHSIYYLPSKIHSHEYLSRVFKNTIFSIKKSWINDYSKIIKLIKTPSQVESDTRTSSLLDGIMDYDESNMHGIMQGMKRSVEYKKIIKLVKIK